MNIKKRTIFITVGLLAVSLVVISIWWLDNKPKPPTRWEIDALYSNNVGGVITNDFQCTVSSEEQSNGITEVWAIAYDPGPGGDFMAEFAVEKIHGNWKFAKDNDKTFNRCMDELSAKGLSEREFGSNWP
jgi:hypothetical protein